MKSIVTGSTGFLGSHLTKRLDDFIAIPHDKIQTANLPSFDYFFFCSSYGNLITQTDEDAIFKANIEDLLKVLSQVKDMKFKSFVFISTSSVKLRIQTTYSRSKKAAEEILLAVMEKNDVPICIIRPYSITGFGEQHSHLIPTLIDAAFTGTQVNLVANPTHDYIDIDDLVDGIISLATHGARGIYELGTGKVTSNIEVLELVEKITGKKINVTFIDSMRPYDNENWVSTNYKARGWGWIPKKLLEQSIREQVDDYKRVREEN